VHLLVTQGDYSTAQTVAASFPAGWRRNRWLGDIAIAQGDDPTALPHYSAALDALREHYAIATDSPAAVIKDEGITDAAALTISAIYAALLLSRAHIHRRMGNSDSAQQDYAAAAILLPDDPTIRIFQAMLAEDGAARAQLRTIFADTPPRRHADLRALLQDDAPHLLDFDGG